MPKSDPAVTEPVPPEGESDAGREEAIRVRAYDISQSEDAGTPEENWRRAEAEIAAPNS